MAHSHRRVERQHHVVYEIDPLGRFQWHLSLLQLRGACHSIILNSVNSSRFYHYPLDEYARRIMQSIYNDEEFSDLQYKDTIYQLCIIICRSSDQRNWNMYKQVQSQSFKTIKTCLKDAIVNVGCMINAKEKYSCVIYYYYTVLHGTWYMMNHLEDVYSASLKSLSRRYICQELWTREEIKCLPKTEVPEMLQNYLLDYWQTVECPPPPLSRQPCGCNYYCDY